MCSKCGCLFGQSPVIHLPVRSHHQHRIDIWDTIECYDVVPSLITLHPAVVGGNRCFWCCLTRFPRCCVVTTPKTSVCNRCWNIGHRCQADGPLSFATSKNPPWLASFTEGLHHLLRLFCTLCHSDWFFTTCFQHVSPNQLLTLHMMGVSRFVDFSWRKIRRPSA